MAAVFNNYVGVYNKAWVRFSMQVTMELFCLGG
jgi:hypothetical protein